MSYHFVTNGKGKRVKTWIPDAPLPTTFAPNTPQDAVSELVAAAELLEAAAERLMNALRMLRAPYTFDAFQANEKTTAAASVARFIAARLEERS